MAEPLKVLRNRRFLGVRDLAAAAGVAPDTIWRIENGEYKTLRPGTMRKIAQALEVHPADIAEFAGVADSLTEGQ